MTKLLCALLSVFFTTCCFSQINISPNILASPFQGDRFIIKSGNDVEGTPLLFDNWKTGKISLTNGDVYDIQKINFNASNSKFVYAINDTLYELQDNVSQVKIFDDKDQADSSSEMLFRNDLLPGQHSFVQVLIKGKITILRQFSKKPEGENYSNGIVKEKRAYVLHTQNVALINNKIIPLKYSSSALAELTADKTTDLDSYIKSNHLKLKKEDDFLQAVNFYNGLP